MSVPSSVNAVVGKWVAVKASAYDRDGSIASLKAKLGKTSIELESATPVTPYTIAATYNWTPKEGGTSRTVAFTAKDNCGKTTTAYSTIRVSEGDDDDSESENESENEQSASNTAPTITVASSVSAPVGTTTIVPITGMDADGDTVKLSIKGPSNVVLTQGLGGNGTVTGELRITPAANQKGKSFTVTVTATDDADNAKQVSKTITVKVGSSKTDDDD